ncbi:MAG: serine--tRNA ligase [Rhodospirillaceae bacterium]|nr:serine--tRNA ligase [Rhodospirillaceae bacterium]
MHDIRAIRENPEIFEAGMVRRGRTVDEAKALTKDILALDTERREIETRAQEIQAARNAAAKEIGNLKSQGGDASALMAEVAKSKDAQSEAEIEAKQKTEALSAVLATIPNIPDNDVPDGKSEDDNVEVRKVGEPRAFDFTAKEHFELGENLGMMDFEVAAKMSGARFVVLSGALARMERALGSLMLDIHTTEFGYTETNPPALVRDNALYNTGQLPKFADDLFKTDEGFWLIPTAEVPLTNLVAGEILSEDYLPRRYTAMTWCFRSEAGSAGKDTRGMIRQHQFTKVELVSVVKPEDSDAELERMTGAAEEILKRLGLPYRTVMLCTGDMGFGAAKTFDIEVWLPGQGEYREISSCSNTRDFQARRMGARFRRAGEKKPEFVNTLNGSGLAVGRALVAVMENYQNADGSITVPDALRPYMGGLEVIS